MRDYASFFIILTALLKSSKEINVVSTKNEYFQGISIIGSDWILVRFKLYFFKIFKTKAKLPVSWLKENFKD